MRVGVIMPHRGDRDQFLPQFHRIIESQTLKPYRLEIIDYPPKDDSVDITPRYREGYNRMTDVDVVLFMEIDDYYTPDYIEKMVGFWKSENKPEILGLCYTIYYHMSIKRYFRFEHYNRSSMMSTLMRTGLDIKWPLDTDPYTDSYLWLNQDRSWKKSVLKPERHICIGIKHGIGKCGGHYHKTHLHRYNQDDKDLRLLKSVMDKQSLDFYLNLELPYYPRP